MGSRPLHVVDHPQFRGDTVRLLLQRPLLVSPFTQGRFPLGLLSLQLQDNLLATIDLTLRWQQGILCLDQALCRLRSLPVLLRRRCFLLHGARMAFLRQLSGRNAGLATFTFVLAFSKLACLFKQLAIQI